MPRPVKLPAAPPDAFVDLHFPSCGIDLSQSFDQQPNRPTSTGDYARTTALGINVRAYEPRTQRARGGARAGLARYINQQVSGTHLIQGMNPIVGVGYSPPGGSLQTSQSGRVVTLVVVSNGDVKVADAGALSWSTPTNGTGALNLTGTVASASNALSVASAGLSAGPKLWFADGTHYKCYDPADNTVHAWVAEAITGHSTLPVDSDGNKPRIIVTWQGRTVLSGLIKDAQNIFFSKIGDPTNWDYNPLAPSAAQAVALNASDFGLIGDVVTSLIDYTDDVLIIGCSNSTWMMQGNPADGGQIYVVSKGIGMAWGVPWTKDPYGQIYFVSNLTGIYQMTPGQTPKRISQPIEQLLQLINTGSHTITAVWDDRWQGFHVFATSTAGANADDRHFFWEMRTNAWFQDSFTNPNHNPLCCCTFDGNTPGDRVALIGSWDGYVRFLSPSATDDDGSPINSQVTIGPILTKDMDDILFKDIQGVLAEASGSVSYNIQIGRTAEAALASTPITSGTFATSRNLSKMVNRAGHALYVNITASNPWAMEAIRCRIQGLGKVRQRGK